MAYQALELGQAGNPACPNAYNEEGTLLCQGSKRLILQVANASICLEFGIMAQGRTSGLGGVVWQGEIPFMEVAGVLHQDFDAVRVRNYAAGGAAEVFLSAESP
jgi:hypothetical protein